MAISYLQTNLQNSAEAVLVARQAEIEALREGNQNLRAYLIQRKAQSQQTAGIYAAEITACEQELLRQVRALEQLQFTPGLSSVAHLETKGKGLLEKKITPSASWPQHAALAEKILDLYRYCGQLGQQIGGGSWEAVRVAPVRAGERASLGTCGNQILSGHLCSLWEKALQARAASQGMARCHVLPTPQDKALFHQASQLIEKMKATPWQ